MTDLLPYRLDRSVAIQATPETVFRFFTDNERWAKWWGAGSTIDAQPGGKLLIRHPGGVETLGEVIEVLPPERIVFTYGYASGKPIPPGGSRVTIRLEPEGQGTRLHLLHELADAAARDLHVQGWRFQLSLFGNLVADEVYAGAVGLVDAWFDAWALTDDRTREDAFARIATTDVRFHDRFSLLDGLADLTTHAGAAQRFMPGVRLERRGEIRHCQGMVLADWFASGSDGQERMSGTSLFVMTPDRRIHSVTGFTNPPARA
jgi:uncharacterized protein YndB with AHSA1/START domain